MAQTKSIFRVPKLFIITVFIAVFAGLGAWYYLRNSKALTPYQAWGLFHNIQDLPILIPENSQAPNLNKYEPITVSPNVKKLRIVLGQVLGVNLLKPTDEENYKFDKELAAKVSDFKLNYVINGEYVAPFPGTGCCEISPEKVGPMIWKSILIARDNLKFNHITNGKVVGLSGFLHDPSSYPGFVTMPERWALGLDIICPPVGNKLQVIGPGGFSKTYACNTGVTTITLHTDFLNTKVFAKESQQLVNASDILRPGNLVEFRILDSKNVTISHPSYATIPNIRNLYY